MVKAYTGNHMKRSHRIKMEIQREAKSWARPNGKGKGQTNKTAHIMKHFSRNAINEMCFPEHNYRIIPPSRSMTKIGCQQDNVLESKTMA